MKRRKLLSAIITISMIACMFVSYNVSADGVTGATEEILSFNFENGSATPSYTYEGETYTSAKQNQAWTSGATDDVWGKKFDRALCIYNNGSDSYFYGKTKETESSLLDIGGGLAVMSWDMAIKDNGCSSIVYIYYNRKETSTGNLAGKTLSMQFDSNGVLLNTGNGFNQYLSSETAPREEWRHYDVVFKYGQRALIVYRDGNVIANLNADNVYGSGWTFAGLGQPDYDNMFAFRIRTPNGSTAYFDNIKVKRYNSAETFTPQFKEDLSGASDNTLSATRTYLNRQDGDFKVVTGAFGKAPQDKSFKIVRAAGVGAEESSKDNFYQRTEYGTNFQYGGKVHIGFNIALEGLDRDFVKYLRVKPTDGTAQDLLYVKYGMLQSGNTSVPVNWESEKWYRFDIYITPGNGNDIYNTMTVYMNGKKMFENIQMADKAFSSIDTLRLGQREKFVSSSGNHEYSRVLYFDDIVLEYVPNGIEVNYPDLSIISLNDEVVRMIDNDTMFTAGNSTIGDVKSVVAVSNVYAVSDAVTTVSDSASAVGKYFLVKLTDDIRVLLPIVDRVDRYSEAFSDSIYRDAAPIESWALSTGAEYTGTTLQAASIGGKSEADRCYVNKAGSVTQNYTYTDAPICVDGKTVIEFSRLMNDDQANDVFSFCFKYKDSLGEEHNSEISTLIWLWRNQIRAFIHNNSENTVAAYTDNQWNKFAVVIDPDAFTADLYINGQLICENARFMPDSKYASMEGCEMTGIYRLNYKHSTASTTQDKYSAIDAIRVYQGDYDSAADSVTISSQSYLLQNNWIAIPDSTDTEDFADKIEISNATINGVFDDRTVSTTEYFDDYDVIQHDQYLVCETPGGAIHYYRIVEQDEPIKVIKKSLIFDGVEVEPDSDLDIGEHNMYLEYEKYNNDEESAYLILTSYLDGEVVDVDIVEEALEFGINQTQEAQLELEESSMVLKAMFWDVLELSPLSDVAKYGIE